MSEASEKGCLHIFVNRRKFEEGDGVRERMTGAQIAALVGVPADNAVVRFDNGPDKREIGINEVVHVKNGEHFLVTRKTVEAAMNRQRIELELARLREGNFFAEFIPDLRAIVLYHEVPTGGEKLGLPPSTDVVVPVPGGYPAGLIDLAGLPVGSPFLPRVKGGQNIQGIVTASGRQWQLASYHPHNGGGGPPWDQMRHGFHTYLDHLIAWLHHLN